MFHDVEFLRPFADVMVMMKAMLGAAGSGAFWYECQKKKKRVLVKKRRVGVVCVIANSLLKLCCVGCGSAHANHLSVNVEYCPTESGTTDYTEHTDLGVLKK